MNSKRTKTVYVLTVAGLSGGCALLWLTLYSVEATSRGSNMFIPDGARIALDWKNSVFALPVPFVVDALLVCLDRRPASENTNIYTLVAGLAFGALFLLVNFFIVFLLEAAVAYPSNPGALDMM